jgi:hypothetical protein
VNKRDDAIVTGIARVLKSEVAQLQAQIDRLTTANQEALIRIIALEAELKAARSPRRSVSLRAVNS